MTWILNIVLGGPVYFEIFACLKTKHYVMYNIIFSCGYSRTDKSIHYTSKYIKLFIWTSIAYVKAEKHIITLVPVIVS